MDAESSMPTPSKVTVRPVEVGDLDDLTDALLERYDERADGKPIYTTLRDDRMPRAEGLAFFRDLIRRRRGGEAVATVAEIGGRAVGFCSITRAGPDAPSEQSHVGELGILVHHDYRGRGIGSRLLEEALREARSKFELVYLSVWSKNEGAVRLYRRWGFTVCGHLPRTVRRAGEYFDEERMVLDFTAPAHSRKANH